MSKLRVNAFSISIDGYGAGPDQALTNPMGEGGMALHQWVFGTRTFQNLHAELAERHVGDEVGRAGVDDDFAARGFENLGAWIMGRHMFGPSRGPWPDDGWKGWWGKNPPYHVRLVDDLLDVSRIARGKVDLRKERFELAAVIARAVEIASPLLERKRQVLTVQVPSQGIPMAGDSDRMAQVFSNLLTNAAKYSAADTHVVLAAERKDERVIVRVKDEGFGIEPHMLDAIFELFTQQRQSADRSQGGLGLGLAIVKNLVMLHGGTVRALSEGHGRGSEFVVDLPTSSMDAHAVQIRPDEAAAVTRAAGASERVLLVDDNEDAAEMLSEALADPGYVVRTAPDGPSALLVAAEFRPQIALLDIGLPVMDGYELGRRMREASPAKALRLIALTGYGQASDRARSTEAGFDAHLVKPIDIRKLRRVLDGLPPSSSRGSMR